MLRYWQSRSPTETSPTPAENRPTPNAFEKKSAMSFRLPERSGAVALALALALGTNSMARAGVDPESNTDGFNPAPQIDDVNEARRQDLIARQVDLNYRMIWAAGYGPPYPDPFEPWPRVPGDVWGYPRPRPIEQPIGHESLQVGPNKWIYRPLYARPEELPPAAAGPRPLAGANRAVTQLPGPSEPEPETPPAVRSMKKVPPGPREF